MIEKRKQLVEIEIDEAVQNVDDKEVSFEKENNIVGMCEQFISKKEKDNRQLNIYEVPTVEFKDWQPMACHFRNIQYTNQNVRTPQSLTNCLQFICSSYLPHYRQVFKNETQRKRLQLFLYDRLRSIKCEFYVQDILIPKVHLKLIKIILFLQTMIGQPVELSCVEQLIAKQKKDRYYKEQDDQVCFQQLLEYALLLSKKQKLAQLLDDHWQSIAQNERIQNTLEWKTKILNRNYIRFLEMLIGHPNIYIRLILWSQMSNMKKVIVSLYKKARMNEKAGFICRILGYRKMEGWINLSDGKDEQRLEKNKQKFDLQIKLWIPESQLMQALQELQICPKVAEQKQ